MCSFPNELIKIDKMKHRGHPLISNSDVCYFLGEYEHERGVKFSDTKKLIKRLKLGNPVNGQASKPKKKMAIKKIASALLQAFSEYDLKNATFIPVPPSKAMGDADYDDRLVELLTWFSLLHALTRNHTQSGSREAFHSAGKTRSTKLLASLYRLDLETLHGINKEIFIFDDVLYDGTHYSVIRDMILRHKPNAIVRGLFLARYLKA